IARIDFNFAGTVSDDDAFFKAVRHQALDIWILHTYRENSRYELHSPEYSYGHDQVSHWLVAPLHAGERSRTSSRAGASASLARARAGRHHRRGRHPDMDNVCDWHSVRRTSSSNHDCEPRTTTGSDIRRPARFHMESVKSIAVLSGWAPQIEINS